MNENKEDNSICYGIAFDKIEVKKRGRKPRTKIEPRIQILVGNFVLSFK